MLPEGRHSSRFGRIAHEIADPVAAWLLPTAVVGVVALCRQASARRGCWVGVCRPCPRAYLLRRLDHRSDPSLRPRCSSRPSSVPRPPRTAAARRSISLLAHTSRVAVTVAAQTVLPCSARFLERVLRPIPRKDPTHFRLRSSALRTWPSPRHDRLGPSIVTLSRLQASLLMVAARVLAPSAEALDAPLGPAESLLPLGACYPALRRLAGRDFHPLETRSAIRLRPRPAPLLHGASWPGVYRASRTFSVGDLPCERGALLS